MEKSLNEKINAVSMIEGFKDALNNNLNEYAV